MAKRLTKVRRELLALLQSGPRVGITDDRTARALEAKGLAFHFYEWTGGEIEPVWTITEAGRRALHDKEGA